MEAFETNIRTLLNWQSLRAGCARRMWCPVQGCGQILDVRRAVEITGFVAGKVVSCHHICQDCVQQSVDQVLIRLTAEDVAMRPWPTFEIIDGREYTVAGHPRKRMKRDVRARVETLKQAIEGHNALVPHHNSNVTAQLKLV